MTTFTGTSGNDNLPPPGSDNSGDDQFFALEGADKIHGGLGDDQVDASSGNDTAWGEEGNDDLSGGADNDTLFGGDGTDHLDGGGGNDIVDGGAGADTMVGNFGNDRYFVDDVGDTLTEFAAGDGFDRVFSSVTFTLGNFFEDLTLTGVAAIDGAGNNEANRLFGNAAANVLTGLDGNDLLDGKGGADDMAGGLGNDNYYVDNANDDVDETGGDGIDRVYSSVAFNFSSASQALGDFENLVLTGVANINGTGNALNNSITGNSGNNELRGLAGNDVLKGNDGDDYLLGDIGNDTMGGGDGDDLLYGAAGADRISGGLDADTFRYRAVGDSTVDVGGRDTLLDFNDAQGDLIDLSSMDAQTNVAGNQAFTFIGAAAFSGQSGELRFQTVGGNAIVSGDVNGNGTADFAVYLKGVTSVDAADFVL
jgi:Ca2+-binding RTX toxin-like protein